MPKETLDREKNKILQVSKVLEKRLQGYINFMDKIRLDEPITDMEIERLKQSKRGLMLEFAELSSALDEIISIVERT